MEYRFEQFKTWIRNPKVEQTICFCLCFTSVGLIMASPGPSLLALADNTGHSVSQMGYIFVARSTGYLLGSAVGGPLFDRFNGNYLIIGSLIMTCFGQFMVPLLSNLVILALCVSLGGVAMGFLDTGGNVSLIWLWGKEVGPYMQSLHFSFGVGAFFAPMIVGNVMEYNDGDPTYAFWATALATLPLAAWLLKFKAAKAPENSSDASNSTSIKEWAIVGLTGLFLCFYVGAEVSTGGYLLAFAVEMHLETESSAAYLTSLFWGTFTLGRLIAIPISLYLTSKQVIAINLGGCSVVTVIWLIFHSNNILLWILVAFYGAFMSSTFPTAVTLAENYVNLTGKLASIFVIGASLGEMIIPLAIAICFDYNPLYMILVLGSCSVAGFVCYVIILFIGKTMQKAEVQYVEMVHEEVDFSADGPTQANEDIDEEF